MIKFLKGLGSAVAFETTCPEIYEYLENFYYLTDSPPVGTEITNCKIERLGKDYLLIVDEESTPVSRERILAYINYKITQILSDKDKESSVCFHASGFVYNGKVFLLFNSSGSGKSTLCSYCLSRGGLDIKYLGDDIIKVDLSHNRVYGLPTAQRIKRGTKKLYFPNKEMYSFDDESNEVWLYKPDNELGDRIDILSAKDIIMINVKYDADSNTTINKHSMGEAVRLLLGNIYNVKSNSRNIIRNLSGMEDVQLFSAVYSNTEEMMKLTFSGFRECTE